MQVVFTPAATGAIAATLTVSSSTLGVTPASVSLNGSGQLSGGLGRQSGAAHFSSRGRRPIQRRAAGDDQQRQQLCRRPVDACRQRPVCAHAEHLHRQPGCRRELHRGSRLSAHCQRHGDRSVDGQLKCCGLSGQRGAFGHGLRFHRRSLRLEQPDRGRRPDRQLHGDNHSCQWSAGDLHLYLRHASGQCALRVQPSHNDGEHRRHRERDCSDFDRKIRLGALGEPRRMAHTSHAMRVAPAAPGAEAPKQSFAVWSCCWQSSRAASPVAPAPAGERVGARVARAAAPQLLPELTRFQSRFLRPASPMRSP